ncbi:hypothetical protein ACJ73_04510 [Blastomyces percursus]|uniref:Uncharacterized protein n=1 Tax=Blastomyces percursus TaxID=1658174 RepID=A0A1J9Q6F7_9EURO|nr:hypothetical protein ACJ73_04510 [Blastomyces percursus]
MKALFQRKEEVPMQLHLESTKDVAVLQSKEWFRLDEPDVDQLGEFMHRMKALWRVLETGTTRLVKKMT